ncbi:hypothetical protein RZE82_03045 [Mollicutes bacterium LVI A0039]|nr:hypothetical protein RZE82_03045 [Mollicutes bacterium LVI A0039]
MYKWIILGHGDFPKGLFSAATDFFGADDSMTALGLGQEENALMYIEKVQTLIGNGTTLLVDFKGGTPYNTAKVLQSQNPTIKLVTGVNMAMLLQIITNPNIDTTQLVDETKNSIMEE